MYYILGLKNSGSRYEHTPHNMGGEILEIIADDLLNSKIIFSKTFMNNSGDNLEADVRQGKPEKLIVIQDDVDMDFGKIKIVFNRNNGGHNGIKDIIQKMKSKKFIRIKIGVCPLDFFGRCRKPKGEALNRYLVYKKLSKRYLKKYEKIAQEVKEIIQTIEKEGLQKAMNKFN